MQINGNDSSIEATGKNGIESMTVSNPDREIDTYEKLCDVVITINASLISLSRKLEIMTEITTELNQFTSTWLRLWSVSEH